MEWRGCKRVLCTFVVLLAFGTGCGREFPRWDPLESAVTLAVLQAFDVVSITPGDGAVKQGITTTIKVSFSRAVNLASITTNVTDTVCSGTVQVSSDNFSTCVRMAVPVPSADGRMLSISAAAAFQSPVTYRLRLLAGVTSGSGISLGREINSGFATSSLVFQTQNLYTGGLGGPTGADTICMTDPGYPGFGNFKAMVVDGVTRTACASTTCNWVFQPTRSYYRIEGTTLILTTNTDAVTGGTVTNSFTGTGTPYWTGLTATWTSDPNDCANWADGTAASFGTFGTGNSTSSAAYSGGPIGCNVSRPLICVQQ